MIDWDKPIEVYDSCDEDAVPAKLIINSNLKIIEWCYSGDGNVLYDVFNVHGEHCLDLDGNRKFLDWLTVRNVEQEKKTNNMEKIKDLVLQLVELLPDDE
ncbi:MAG TPA: hypothetical protein HA367_01275 [Candidatus Methanofastidiosum sp.]|nr:hypothetical protein [Methanofastidiosum sp.]